jgi:phosphoglycolate phosphatase
MWGMTSQPLARPFTVGFDLDLTLVDSVPGIRAAYESLAATTGTYIDIDLVCGRLGPPLEQELANWFPADGVADALALYRSLYPALSIHTSPAMPGAVDALAAVRELGGRSVVVTAKYEKNARLHLDHLGLTPDALVGDLWAAGKAVALREHGATVYVGDHVGDVLGARTAGALSVAVPTGPCDADELRAAGADVILDDLRAFPGWLRAYRAGAVDAAVEARA